MRSAPLLRRSSWAVSSLLAVGLIAPNAGCFTLIGLATGARGQTLSNLAQADAAVATVVVAGAIDAAARGNRRRARAAEPLDPPEEESTMRLGFPATPDGEFCSQISVAIGRRVPHRLALPYVNEQRLMVVELTEEEQEAFLSGVGLDFDVCGRNVTASQVDREARR